MLLVVDLEVYAEEMVDLEVEVDMMHLEEMDISLVGVVACIMEEKEELGAVEVEVEIVLVKVVVMVVLTEVELILHIGVVEVVHMVVI